MNTHILKDAIAELEAERHDLEATIARLRAMTQKEIVVTQNESFVGLGIAEAATRYLQEVGAPKSTREIMTALKQRGVTVKRYQTVYGLLHRRKQMKHDLNNSEGRWVALGADHHASH